MKNNNCIFTSAKGLEILLSKPKAKCTQITVILFLLLPAILLAQPSPATDPGSWLLAFLDVETTGLTPGHHEIVNVGIVLSDLDGNEKARLLLYIQPIIRNGQLRRPLLSMLMNRNSGGNWERFRLLLQWIASLLSTSPTRPVNKF